MFTFSIPTCTPALMVTIDATSADRLISAERLSTSSLEEATYSGKHDVEAEIAQDKTYSILPTDRFGTLKRTSGGLVVLLLEAVEVPLPTAVVADEPGAVTEGEADALMLVVAVSLDAVVVAADCADANGSRRHRAEKR